MAGRDTSAISSVGADPAGRSTGSATIGSAGAIPAAAAASATDLGPSSEFAAAVCTAVVSRSRISGAASVATNTINGGTECSKIFAGSSSTHAFQVFIA